MSAPRVTTESPDPASDESESIPHAIRGLAANLAAFVHAVRSTVASTGLPAEQIIHDYWLVRALHSVTGVLPESGEISAPGRKPSSPARRLGRWGFGGGTSLTAANKFDALHRRAVKGDLDGVSARGRDLYDLWALARSQHADAIRERTPHLWDRAAGGMRDAVPRPSHGYSHSPAFVPGTEANAALETGFGHAVALTVWGDAPDFEQALQAARSLDT